MLCQFRCFYLSEAVAVFAEFSSDSQFLFLSVKLSFYLINLSLLFFQHADIQKARRQDTFTQGII